MGSSAHFCVGRFPPGWNVSITRRLNSGKVEASVILKVLMFMRTYSTVHNATDWIHEPRRWFFKTCACVISRSRFPWALSIRNQLQCWRVPEGRPAVELQQFCNRIFTKNRERPHSYQQSAILIYAPAAEPLAIDSRSGSSRDNPGWSEATKRKPM